MKKVFLIFLIFMRQRCNDFWGGLEKKVFLFKYLFVPKEMKIIFE